jgi:uroporphyrinogen decarboxylase
VYQQNGYYLEMIGNPLREATLDDLDRYPWPDPYDPARIRGLEEEVKYWYEQTDYALVGGLPCGGMFESCTWLRGMDKFLMDLITDKDFSHALMSKILALHQGFFSVFLDIVGPYIDIIETADDFGIQTGLLISPKLYREMVKPYHQALFETIKSKTNARIFLHSCGSVVDIVDELIDAGVEVLNPVQPLAKGMGDPVALNKRFGKQIVFHGGIDIQKVLPTGTIEDVYAEVKKRISGLAPGGGYILAAAHNIQVDVPSQNIVAMFDAAHQYGTYPHNQKRL